MPQNKKLTKKTCDRTKKPLLLDTNLTIWHIDEPVIHTMKFDQRKEFQMMYDNLKKGDQAKVYKHPKLQKS